MELQKVLSRVRKAVDTYGMIKEGDRIAVGVSGGKDSLCLLYALAGLRRFYTNKFDIVAITVDLGYESFDTKMIASECEKLEVEYHVVKTKINEMIASEGCSLCARLRKGALMEKVKERGCNVIAYAHNMDDVVETMMMSLIYEGRFSTFWPVTEYEDTGVRLIRPLVLMEMSDVIGFANRYELHVVKNPCPFDKHSERGYIRELLGDINHHAPGVKKRMMTAICDGTIKEWS